MSCMAVTNSLIHNTHIHVYKAELCGLNKYAHERYTRACIHMSCTTITKTHMKYTLTHAHFDRRYTGVSSWTYEWTWRCIERSSLTGYNMHKNFWTNIESRGKTPATCGLTLRQQPDRVFTATHHDSVAQRSLRCYEHEDAAPLVNRGHYCHYSSLCEC